VSVNSADLAAPSSAFSLLLPASSALDEVGFFGDDGAVASSVIAAAAAALAAPFMLVTLMDRVKEARKLALWSAATALDFAVRA